MSKRSLFLPLLKLTVLLNWRNLFQDLTMLKFSRFVFIFFFSPLAFHFHSSISWNSLVNHWISILHVLKATHVFNELNVFNSYVNCLPGSASPFGYYYFTFNIFFVFNFCRARVSTNKDSCVVEDEGRVGSLNVEWNSFLPRTKWCNFTKLMIYAWIEKKDGWLHSRLKNLLLTSVLTYSRKTHSECLGLNRSFIRRLCWRLSVLNFHSGHL